MSLRAIVVYFTKMRSAEQICLKTFSRKHSITLTSPLMRFISALTCQLATLFLTLMNTISPFFPALVRLISALLSFLNTFMITINALLDIESVDRYKLPPALFWRLQAHSWDNTAAVLAAGPGNKPFKN